MALACLGKVKSRVKGHHVYDHNYKVNEELECFLELDNKYSKNAIIVKSKDIVVGHVPRLPIPQGLFGEFLQIVR